jgi:hypothetical protein
MQARLLAKCFTSTAVLTSAAGRKNKEECAMSTILIFTANWNKWYRVLHYRKGLRRLDSVRFGLWLARG